MSPKIAMKKVDGELVVIFFFFDLGIQKLENHKYKFSNIEKKDKDIVIKTLMELAMQTWLFTRRVDFMFLIR
jgi:hypothetical protein